MAHRGVRITHDKLVGILANVKLLTGKEVLVGITAEKDARQAEPGEKAPAAGNALIGYVMETGLPEKNIPQRSFLVPGVQNNQDRNIKRLREAGINALDGEIRKMLAQFEAIGLETQASVQKKITSGPFAPLSPRTIAARARRGRQGAIKYLQEIKAGRTPSGDLVKPLIDTGQLRQAITYVVVDRGAH